MDKKAQINFWYIIIAIFGILIIQSMYSQYTKVEPIPYSRFHELLDQGKIAEIAITQNHIYGSLKEKGADGIKDFVTTRVESDLAEKLDKHNVTYTGHSAEHVVARPAVLDLAHGYIHRYLAVSYSSHEPWRGHRRINGNRQEPGKGIR